MLIAIFNCTAGNSDFGLVCLGSDLDSVKMDVQEWLGNREDFGHAIAWDGHDGEVEIYGNVYEFKVEVCR